MKIRNIKPGKEMGLSATLAIAFFVLSVAVLVISSALQLISNVQSQQEAITSQQQLIAQEAARTVGNFVQEKFSVLEASSALANPADATTEEQQRIVGGLLGLQPAFRQLILLDALGQEMARASRLSRIGSRQLTEALGGDVLERVKQGEKYISPVYIDEVTSEPLTILAVPVTNVFGDFKGMLVAEVNLKFMWDLMDQLKVGQTGYAYVVDETGTVIAFNDTARVLLSEKLNYISEVEKFVSNPLSGGLKDVDTFAGINGGRVVGTYVPLVSPPWAVVTEMPWGEAYQPVFRTTMWNLVIILIMAALAGLMGVFLARRLSVPLVSLMETANRITHGEIGLQATVAGPKEVVSLATAFNSMTAQLRGLISTLEQRVADRTRALETSTEVSRRLSTILNQNELVTAVVEEVQQAFNYYHAHIYLLDESGENLVMVGGTGEADRKMLESGHKITKGHGLVGRAAEDGEPVLVADTAADPSWLPNPLLPETRSEAAVPIVIGGKVLGVLDVQQNVVGGLTQTDVDLLQSIAGQVAVAVQNARLYTQMQRQAQYETQINQIGQKLQQTLTVEDTLQVALRELSQALEAPKASIRLGGHSYNGDGQTN